MVDASPYAGTKRLMHARHYIYWPVGILKLSMDKGFCWLACAPPDTIQEHRVAEIYDSYHPASSVNRLRRSSIIHHA
jgi:hypothetical protein